MPKIKCKLISVFAGSHIQQLYTGFFMLYKRGLIDLTQNILKEKRSDTTTVQHLRNGGQAHLRVILNNSLRLHYDAHDSWEIDEEYLSKADFYFKRSFSSSHLRNLGKDCQKIHPLGLNYRVYPSSLDKFALLRSMALVDKEKKLLEFARSLNLFNGIRFTPRVHIMESLPDYNVPPKILFMVRAWNPYDDPDRLKEKIEERICINETRANCIKLLREEFGNNFYGGFIHTDYAIEHYKDFLMPDKTLSSKRNYIKLLKSYPICIATTGLHGSIGWKFAEYIAFSKAILSEKLTYEVPGDLRIGENYLEFISPEDCVEKAKRLFSDKELRNYLMTNNTKYYHSHLRPDSLILNTILTALSKGEY